MYFRPWFWTGDLFDCTSNVGNVITHGGIIYCSQSREEKLSFFTEGRGSITWTETVYENSCIATRSWDKTINNRKQLPFPRRNATANMVTRGWPRNDESIEKRSVLCFVAIQALKSLLRAEQRRERFLGSVSFLEYLSHFWDRSIEMRTRIGKFE